MKKTLAFTLVEVLITIAVIGIVFALTIPNLISLYRTKVTVNKLNKINAMLNQAFRLAIDENGPVNTWSNGSSYAEHATAMADILKNYLKYSSYCEIGNQNCTHFVYSLKREKRSGLSTSSLYGAGAPTFILLDGTILTIVAESGDRYLSRWCISPYSKVSAYTNYLDKCGYIKVDINGKSGPNQDGYDYFAFIIYQDSIIPAGSGASNTHSSDSFSKCKDDNWLFGFCTAWLMEYKNMDYLKCPNKLSWSGVHRCKDSK